jgi:hypothetical protein
MAIIVALLALAGCGSGASDQATQDQATLDRAANGRAAGDRAAEDQADEDLAASEQAAGDQAAADYANAVLPGSGPGTYKFVVDGPGTVGRATYVPFEFYGMNLLVHGKMNGKKVKLLIDNGRLWDQVWFYDGEVDSLGIRYLEGSETGRVVGSGEDGGSDIHEGHPVDIYLAGVQFFDQPVLISPPEAGFGDFFPGIAGQVSSMLFKHFVVTFDFDRNLMILTKPEAFEAHRAGTPVPMKLAENGAYVIPATIRLPGKEELDLNLDIDLGGIYPLHFIENESLKIVRPDGAKKKHLGYGASGEITGYEGQIEMIRVGGHTLNNVTSVFTEEGANVDVHIVKSGTVGLPLFKRFNITFDYFNNLLYLKPNSSFHDSFE